VVGNTEAKVGNINTEVDNTSEGEGIERPRHISGGKRAARASLEQSGSEF